MALNALTCVSDLVLLRQCAARVGRSVSRLSLDLIQPLFHLPCYYCPGTTGTIEGVYFVKTGHLVKLSQQQLIDCSWNEGDNGCDGGEDFRAYEYIIKVNGLSTEEDYGSYLGEDGRCHDKTVNKAVRLTGFYNVTTGDSQALEAALFYNGPVTVAIDASHKSLSFYSHGVYYEPNCKNKPQDLDHQVCSAALSLRLLV